MLEALNHKPCSNVIKRGLRHRSQRSAISLQALLKVKEVHVNGFGEGGAPFRLAATTSQLLSFRVTIRFRHQQIFPMRLSCCQTAQGKSCCDQRDFQERRVVFGLTRLQMGNCCSAWAVLEHCIEHEVLI